MDFALPHDYTLSRPYLSLDQINTTLFFEANPFYEYGYIWSSIPIGLLPIRGSLVIRVSSVMSHLWEIPLPRLAKFQQQK